MGRKPTGRPQGRPRNETLDICLVPPCGRVAYARHLCKAHYTSLSRALKAGRPWDLQTGKPTPSGYKPRSPFDQPDLALDEARALANKLTPQEIDEVRAHVEIDAARVLPHVLGFCVTEMVKRAGLLNNAEAAAAFAEVCAVAGPAMAPPPTAPHATARPAQLEGPRQERSS